MSKSENEYSKWLILINFIELGENEIYNHLWVILLLFMSLFVIDLEENIMEKDSKLSFTLKPCLKKSGFILSFISKHNVIFCKKKGLARSRTEQL